MQQQTRDSRPFDRQPYLWTFVDVLDGLLLDALEDLIAAGHLSRPVAGEVHRRLIERARGIGMSSATARAWSALSGEILWKDLAGGVIAAKHAAKLDRAVALRFDMLLSRYGRS